MGKTEEQVIEWKKSILVFRRDTQINTKGDMDAGVLSMQNYAEKANKLNKKKVHKAQGFHTQVGLFIKP